MTLLVPPSEQAAAELLKKQEAVTTPSLGFHYFWHQRHDQPRTSPGIAPCRHCKTLKKAGAVEADVVLRKTSCLPAVAMFVAGSRVEPRQVATACVPAGPSGLVLQEFFAGKGVITAGWKAAGEVALEPVELFADPHRQQGRREQFDLANPTVQARYLREIEEDKFNLEWLACPCTTFCDWNLQNRGTRTFDRPLGKPTEKEAYGNNLSNFGAVAFEKALVRGHFPIAESSGLSGRYPKQWHLPAWQRLLRRPDVDFLEVDMCAYGLGPVDATTGSEYYKHRTGLAFPRLPGFRLALSRLCPGLSATHHHVPLQGARPGMDVTRCTEAGVYAPAFVQAVVEALQTFLIGGGGRSVPRAVPGPRKESTYRAGGQRLTKGEGEVSDPEDLEESESSFEEEVEEDVEVEVEVEVDPDGEGEQSYEPDGDDGDGDDGDEGPYEEGAGEGGESERESVVDGTRGDEQGFDPMVELAVDCPGGDSYWVDEARGQLWIFSRVPRRRLIVPGGEGCPFAREDFTGHRYSRCVPVDGTEIDAWEVHDDFHQQGNCFIWGPDQFWTGTTVLLFRGQDPLPDFPWTLEYDSDSWGNGPSSDPEDEGDCGDAGAEGADKRGSEGVSSSSWSEGSPAAKRPRERCSGESHWTSFEAEGLGTQVEKAAIEYVRVVDELEGDEVDAWRRVQRAGDELLSRAGSVEKAAVGLWIAREKLGRNNLSGVDDEALDELLPPDMLSYLRAVRKEGMPARFVGERQRVSSNPHPRARANMKQVYQQLMKDVAKHRVLVVRRDHERLEHTVSSPFEAVPKMLPNRTLSKEVRLVHDQRAVNRGTDKELHPPAVQPMHRQIVRRILWLKMRYPGVDVCLAKKDVAGAFRLLWVDPRDVELFGGDVGWCPQEMGAGGKAEDGDPVGLTMLYLVSSFGFSGSPGEWNVWGRATEELHRQHHPAEQRRDGSPNFDGKILVDDMVLVEPMVGLRPWISSETYEWAVVKLLGAKAVNALKDAEEGEFASSQLVWGVHIDAQKERMSLPESRIAKGAHLLQAADFGYGEKTLTLKDLQRFRGIATGWATIVKGLKNELKAADRFLAGVDGGAIVSPSRVDGSLEQEEAAWEDLWALFEDCRWLCARSETWAEKFGGDIRELLEPMERISIPGCQFNTAIFVSSDATLDTLAAIDWTNGLACREELSSLRPWIERALVEEGLGVDDKVAIHIGEMLSLVAFACRVGAAWSGRVVVYGGDNKIVFNWVLSRKAGVRAGRLLIRVLNLVEMRFRCQILGGWWRTFHNEDADALTRLERGQAEKFMEEKGWTSVDIKEAISQALKDTERFGACFLSWADQEDREEQMRLRELRMFRALHRQPHQVSSLQVVEWTASQRLVKDFEYYQNPMATGPRVVAASIGPDPHARKVQKFMEFVEQEVCEVALLEGPREVAWDVLDKLASKGGWATARVEYLTSELGEVLVRRRMATFLHGGWCDPKLIEEWLVRAVTAPSLGTCLKPARAEDLIYYDKYEDAVAHGGHAMLPIVGGHVWFGGETTRRTAYRLGGPGKWPLANKGGEGFESLWVVDKRAPTGTVRRLNKEEVWIAQGRLAKEWEVLKEQVGEERAAQEGNFGTGRRTALALLMVAAEIAGSKESSEKAGMCLDMEDYQSLATILQWLRRWRRGIYNRAEPERKAGGCTSRKVWFWGEELWVEALLDLDATEEEHKAGGRRKKSPEELKGEKVVHLQEGVVGDLNVQAQIEEWLDDHMHGDQAQSTRRAYQAAWQKWTEWANRQGWETPYLNPKGDPVENEDKILGYIGYLGWLGTSVATLKQAIFAVKDAHKRAGHGDATGKMHRLWIVINSLDRMAERRPRRLGVTVPMLKWMDKHLSQGGEEQGELKVNCRMLQAALLTAWFFMLRVREFADSGGIDEEMVLRGHDIQLSVGGDPVREGQKAEEVTLQFRKTKADQTAFGTCKTMVRTGVQGVCVVEALEKLKEVAPRRFGGPEALQPLFRWASGAVLKRMEIQNILQKAAKAVGLPAERFQSHSLRIGGASALFQATGEVEVVKRTGRWSSGSVHRYLHDSGDVLKKLSQKMASVDQFVHYT